MESFCYTAAPCPTRKPFLEPSVPDASLLMNVPASNTYQEWKNNFNNADQNKKVTTSILKKQVRFNGPVVPSFQQNEINCSTEKNNGAFGNHNPKSFEPQYNTPPLNKVLKNKPFQEIYMANIPNRHLDLSLIDVNKPVNNTNSTTEHGYIQTDQHYVENSAETFTPPSKTPTTYKEFLEMQKNLKESQKPIENHRSTDCITDIFNYTSPRIDPRQKQIKMGKFNCEKPETLRKRECDKLDNNTKLPSQNSKILHKDNMEKENICHDNSKIPVSQQLLPSSKNVHHDYDSFNFMQDTQRFRTQPHKIGQICDTSVQTSILTSSENEKENKEVTSTEIAKNTDEPSVKDLLKIIQQQNEQLLVLQKQVASLIDFKDGQKRIEDNNQRINEEIKFKHPVKDQRDFLNSAGSTPRKGPLPKFSIDLMTSFEVSFRPQQNMYQRKQRDFITQEPKIQEIIENDTNAIDYSRDSAKRVTDPSLYLQEPITVPESCPSPEPSINIDMKDYESSEEDDEDTASDIGATFYRNMMDQVNKIIQTAQKQTTYDGKISRNDDLKERTISKVRDATIKQLKKIGMNFSPIEEVSDANCSNMSEDDSSEQINLAVKQLLMKYLPDDQLSKFTTENSNGGINKKRSTDKIILNSRGPQFSFATVQFMKKYDLIASDGNEVPRRLNIQEKSKPRMYKGVLQNNPKILDISTLKQQPKLL